MACGPERLSTGELLAILLRSGTRGESAVDLAQRLLLMREQLKGAPRKERAAGGRARSSLLRQMRGLKAK